MQNEDFDHYFERAALEHEIKQMENNDAARRGSLPNQCLLAAPLSPVSSMRRTASCKTPRQRQRTRSRSPQRRASALSADKHSKEDLLKAPAPDNRPHSAPHSRSSSWKKSRRPRSARPGDLADGSRSRSGSISLEDTVAKLEQLKLLQSEDVYPVRSFATSARGLVNRGDSFKRKTNKQVTSCDAVVNVSGLVQSRDSPELDHDVMLVVDAVPPVVTSEEEKKTSTTYQAHVIGVHGVGKSALLQQFMTSDYIGATESDTWHGDDDNVVTVTVLLDGEATSIDFVEVNTDQEVQFPSDVDIFVFVFALNDRDSFRRTQHWLDRYRKRSTRPVAVILVANKSDLVRNRQVKDEEARDVCRRFNCKYSSVSAVVNHKVDELLAGIAKQIQLNPQRATPASKPAQQQAAQQRATAASKSASKPAQHQAAHKTTHHRGPKGIFGKLFNRKQNCVNTSCDNLMAL